MKVIFRITRPLLEEIKTDLARPHSFALERVGFIYVRPGTISDGQLLLATSYQSVRDEHYTKPKPEDYVGAIISRYAITEAMQKVLNTGEGAFHVHLHHYDLFGEAFSSVDLKSLKELMPNFYAVRKNALHGALLLTPDNLVGKYWTRDSVEHNITGISVIGYPCFYQKKGFSQ